MTTWLRAIVRALASLYAPWTTHLAPITPEPTEADGDATAVRETSISEDIERLWPQLEAGMRYLKNR